MPNLRNVESPITLISFGRSGTSLLSQIFDLHPECCSVNETTNLIFGVWHAVESSAAIISPLVENGVAVSTEERAARAVRQAFLACFSDNQPYWFQKPITLPRAISDKFPGPFDENRWSEAAEWYWKVITTTFPRARFFTILRHPCDIVLSARAYWHSSAAEVWEHLSLMAYFLTHPASPVQYAVHFEELIQKRESVIGDLFTFLELPLNDKVFDAFSEMHVPSRPELPASTSTAHQANWDQLDPTKVSTAQLKRLRDLFEKFGYSFQLPSQFTKNSLAAVKPLEDETPEQTIQRLLKQIDVTHFNHAAEIAELKEQIRQTELLQAHLKQQSAFLETLYRSRAWRWIARYWALKEKLTRGGPSLLTFLVFYLAKGM